MEETPQDSRPHAQPEPPIAELLDRAESSIKNKQWAEALTVHTGLLAGNPYSGRLWYQLAIIYDHLGNREEAIQAYCKAIDTGYNIPEAAYEVGRNLAVQGQTAQAVTWLERAIARSPRNLKRLETDPDLDRIRNDPAFLRLLPPHLPAETSRVDGWRADLHYMATRIEAVHYDLFRVLLRKDWHAAVKRLHHRIPELEDHEINVELMRITAMVGDGHTSVAMAGEPTSFGRPGQARFRFDRIPLVFYLFKDGLFTIAAAPKYRNAVGYRVLRVGDVSAGEALTAVRETISRDNEMTVRWLAPFALTYPALLYALRISRRSDEVELVMKGEERAAQRKVTFQAEPNTDPFHYRAPRPGWVTAMDRQDASVPLYLRDPDNFYWFVYVEDPKVVYFQFNQVRSKEAEPLEAFLTRLFEFVNTDDVAALVIDLRLNNGGNLVLNRLLLHQIIRCDKVNRKGRLFTIIGRRTFSAAMHLTAQLQLHTRTLFVGEPTGSSPNFIGEDNEFTLPYSGLTVSASHLYHQGSFAFDDRIWVAPDIAAELTFGDFRSKRDPAMDAVLQYLKGK